MFLSSLKNPEACVYCWGFENDTLRYDTPVRWSFYTKGIWEEQLLDKAFLPVPLQCLTKEKHSGSWAPSTKEG